MGRDERPFFWEFLMSDSEDFLIFQSFLNGEKTEKGVVASFYNKFVRTGRFLENGLPEFSRKVFIKIRVVNSIDEVDRPAEDADIHRFAREYALFKIKNENNMNNGTPLNQFAFLSPAQIECCEFRNVFTIEDLIALEDDKASTLGLFNEKEAAKKFLEASKNNKMISDFENKIHFLESEIVRLKEENEILKAKDEAKSSEHQI